MTAVLEPHVKAVRARLREIWAAEAMSEESVIKAQTHNLVIVAHSLPQEANALANRMVGITTERPGRVILVLVEPDAEPDVRAEAMAFCRVDGRRQVCGELITLEAGGDTYKELHSTIIGLLAPSLPVFVWWGLPLDREDHLLSHLLPEADRLLVDSHQYPGVLPVLAQMAATPRSDLNWNRLAPWRQLLARLWDAHGASALAHINSVDIHHAQGAQVRALLLLSWLASRLDWTLNTAERTASGGLLTRWRAGPALHDLKAELLPVAANGSEPGSLQGIYIQAGAEPPYVMPRLELAGDCVELRRDESSLNSQFMPFQPVDLTGALAAEIDNDPDPHLMAALDISAALLSELKS